MVSKNGRKCKVLDDTDRDGYTPTQNRLLDLLEDGMPHTRQELQALLGDPEAVNGVLRNHLSMLKRRMRKNNPGFEIVCYWGAARTLSYRMVRLLNVPK